MSVSEAHLREVAAHATEMLDKFGGRWRDKVDPSTPAFAPHEGRSQDLFQLFLLAQVRYLLPAYGGRRLDERAADAAIVAGDYFCGPWHQTYPEIDIRKQWFDELRIGLLLSLVAQRTDILNQLLGYPQYDLPHDEGSWNRTRSDNQFYIALGKSLVTAEAVEPETLKGKRPALLWHIVGSILAADSAGFATSFAIYMKWYKKNEFPHQGNNLVTCLDGSILLQIAKMRGMDTQGVWTMDQDLLINCVGKPQ